MWRLYLKSNEGIAIKTTVERLLKSFSNTPENIYCSKIRYLDYENDGWYDEVEYPWKTYNFFMPLVHKRVEFKQEAEVRLIHDLHIPKEKDLDQFWEQQQNQKGKDINLKIETLVDTVYSSPTCDKYQIEKIQEMVTKYNFDFKVQKSELSKEPYY